MRWKRNLILFTSACNSTFHCRLRAKQQSCLSSPLILSTSNHPEIDYPDFGDPAMQWHSFLPSFTSSPGFLFVRHHSYLNEQSVCAWFWESPTRKVVSVYDPVKTAIFQCFVDPWLVGSFTVHWNLLCQVFQGIDWLDLLQMFCFPEISYWPWLNWLWLIRASRVICKTFIWKSL